ncbi:MAG: LamG domain-containing protein [Myxococcales bacterium]|nr:LamG domain-containing protein [Myxococcales bacterium]
MTQANQITVLQFDGVDDFVEASSFPWPQGGPITIEFWTKVDVADIGRSIFTIGDANIPHRAQAHAPWNNGRIVWDYGDFAEGRVESDFAPYLGRWTHVAMVSAGNGGGFRAIYLNGVLVASAGQSDGPDTPLSGLLIGRWWTFFHKGQVADFRVWNRVRAGVEIVAEMHRRLSGDEAGLVGYWPLSDGQGAQAVDLAGGHHGVIHGARWVETSELVLRPADAPSIRGLHFDGVDDYVAVPTMNLQSNTVTIEAWIKPSGPQNDWDGLVYCRGGATIAGLNLMANNEIRYNWNDVTWSWSSGLIAPIGEWSHVALVIEPTRATLYLNGVPRTNAVAHAVEEFNAETWIGRDAFQGQRYFSGEIAEVRVWNKACSSAELAANRARRMTGSERGLVGCWRLDEGQGDQATDRASGRSGAIHGATWTDAPALADELAPASGPVTAVAPRSLPVVALGGDRHATLPGVQALLYDRSFTVECWIKLDSTNGDQTVLGTEEKTTRHGLHLVVRSGHVYCGFYADDTAGATILSTGRWTHVAYSYDKEKQVQRVFVDGVLDGMSANRPSWIGVTDVQIGRWELGHYLHGSLAELRIWDHARGEDLLVEHMTRRASGVEPGLVALYPLDDGSGVALRELVEARAGALNTAGWAVDDVTLAPAPTMDHALSLRAESQQFAALPDVSPLLRDQSFTVECWVKPYSTAGYQTVLGNDGPHGPNTGLMLGLRDGKANLGFWANDTGGVTIAPVGVWTHLAWVYDKDAQVQRVYVNGALDGERSGSAAWVGAGPMRLGRTATTYYFDGQLSELRIWSRARDAAEIAANMGRRLSGLEGALAAYFPLDEGSGATLDDSIGGAPGVVQSGARVASTLALAAAPAPRKVLALSGSQHASLPTARALLYDKSFTVEAWVKLDATDGHHSILGSWQPEPRKTFFFGVIDGRAYQSYYGDDTAGVRAVPKGKWTHLAYTYDAATGIPRLYVDGALDREGAPKATWIGDEEVRLGVMGEGRPLEGQVAELRIWDRARSRTELQEMMGRRASGLEAGLVAHYPLDEQQGLSVRERVSGVPGVLTDGTRAGDVELALVEGAPRARALELQAPEYGVLPGVRDILHDKSFTVEAWVWPARYSADEPILGTNLREDRKGLNLTLSDGFVHFGIYGFATVTEARLPVRAWSHVAFVYDRERQIQRCYVNGALAACRTGAPSWIGTEEVQLGRWSSDRYFHGRVRELRVWDHARALPELHATMRARLGAGVPGLRRSYPLDQVEGGAIAELVEDAAGSLVSGDWVDEVSLDLGAAGARVLALRGNDHALLPGVQAMIRESSFSLEAWIKLDHVDGTHALLGTDDPDGDQEFRLLVVDGALQVRFRGNTTVGATTLSPGVWAHVAFTYDVGGDRRLYLNGDLEQRTSSLSVMATQPVQLGRSREDYLAGCVAELRVWDHARAQQQIRATLGRRLRGDEPGLAAYLPLDDDDGVTLREPIQGRSGQLVGGVWMVDRDLPIATYLVRQPMDTLRFDGATQIEVPGLAQHLHGSFTVEAWVNPRVHKFDATILGSPSNVNLKSLHLVIRDGRPYMGFHNADTAGATVLRIDRWTHLAFTYDADAQTQRIYVNGKLDGEGPGRPPWAGDDPIYVGRWSASPFFFEGLITEMRIWSESLTANDIRARMTKRLRGDETSLVRYLPLDEAHGAAIRELAVDHELAAPPETDAPAIRPVHVLELGSGHHGALQQAQPLLYDRSFTVECWLKLNTIGGDQGILGTARSVAREGLHLVVRSGRLYMGFYAVDTEGTTTLPVGTWVHAAWVYDKETQTQRVYLNGVLDGEGSNRASWIGPDELHLGYSYFGVASLQGSLSELRIWDHARTAAQLRATMHQRLTGVEPGLAALHPLSTKSAKSGVTLYDTVRGLAGQLQAGVWRDDPSLPIGAARSDLWYTDPVHPMQTLGDHALELGAGAYGALPALQPILRDRSFTIECWVKFTRDDQEHVILGTTDSRTREGLYLMLRQGRIWFGFYNCDVQSSSDVPLHEWVHLACVYDKAAQTQRIYVNGVLDGEASQRASFLGNGEVKLGYCFDGGRWLYGRLRELRVWGYARDVVGVNATMGARLVGSEPGLKALYSLDSWFGGFLRERVAGDFGWLLVGGSWVKDDALSLADGAVVNAVGSSPLGVVTGSSSLGDPIGEPTIVAEPPAELESLGTLSISVFFVDFDFDLSFPGEITVEPLSLATTYTGSATIPAPFDVAVDPLVVALAGSDWTVKFGLPGGALTGLYDGVRGGIPGALLPATDGVLRPFLGAFGDSTIILSSAEGEDEDRGGYLAGFNAFTTVDLGAIPPFSLLSEALSLVGVSADALSIPVTLGLGCDPRNGDFFVGMVYEPDPSLTLIPGLLEFKSVGLDVRKQAINVSAGAQIAFTLNLGGEALNLVGGISGQSAGSVTVWGSLDADDGAWEDPFGIKGLTIVGMGLEVGFTTDFPFIRVGVRGEASIGGGLLDASIAILLDGLDPANAILALRSDAGINLPALVDAMTGVNPGGVLDVALTDLDLYYAPSGGTIAGKVYEPGLRLAAKLGLWGFHASVAGEFDFAGGGSLAGAMDPLVFKAGSTTFLQVTSFSGSGGASINLNFTPSSVAASIDGKIRLLGGAFEYGVQGTLSTSGLSMNLSGGTPGLYQNASLWIGDQRCKLSFGVTVGVKIPIGGFNVDISAGAAVETEVTLQWFAHRVTFSYAAMGHTYSATVSIYVPFASVGDVANAFGNAAGAIASELAGALVNLGAAAFNWFKSNISQAASEAATFFKNIGANAADTAEGLVNHMGAAAGDAVRYLNLGAEESARILRESFNWGVDATGEWLEDTFTMGSGELKSVLNDAGYLAEDVGDWINDTFNPSNW